MPGQESAAKFPKTSYGGYLPYASVKTKRNQGAWKEAGAAHGAFPLLINGGCCAS